MRQTDDKSMEIIESKVDTNKYEEMETVEELGNTQDYLTGVGIGLGIVVGIVTLT